MNLCIGKHGIFILDTIAHHICDQSSWDYQQGNLRAVPQTGLYAFNGWLLRSLHQFQDLSIICIRLAKQTDIVITGYDAANGD